MQLSFEHAEGLNFHFLRFCCKLTKSSIFFCVYLHWNNPNYLILTISKLLLTFTRFCGYPTILHNIGRKRERKQVMPTAHANINWPTYYVYIYYNFYGQPFRLGSQLLMKFKTTFHRFLLNFISIYTDESTHYFNGRLLIENTHV